MAGGATSTHRTARLLGPDLLERGRANVLTCPLYSAGSLVAPDSGTVTIRDGSDAVVSAASATITGDVATYSYTPPATLSLGEGWTVTWVLTIGSDELEVVNEAALVRRRLSPVVTDADLFRRVPSLDPAGSATITSATDYQDFLDEAWAEIQQRLIDQGNRPNLILSPSALRRVHLYLTLALIFEDLSTRLREDYTAQADRYRGMYSDAWRELNFVYDTDDDGVAETPARRRAATPTIWLGGRG